MSGDDWRTETLYPDFRMAYKASEVLHEVRTEHQDLVLFENPRYGRMLMLDGITQLTTSDEFIYHEMMAHVPILAHGAASSILIVGGGDGGVAREVFAP